VKCTDNEKNIKKENKLPRSERERQENRSRLRRKRRREFLIRRILGITLVFVLFIGAIVLWVKFPRQSNKLDMEYDIENPVYGVQFGEKSLSLASSFASDLCVAGSDVTSSGLVLDDCISAGLFDLNKKEVLYSKNIYETIYPASITKLVTALVAIKYGDLDSIVTVSEYAVDLDYDSQKCDLLAGDKIPLRDLLHGVLIWSGNDAAIAVAEHIAGSEEAFVEMMNQEVKKIGATKSNFVNSHGLHDDNHYTTAYDIYQIFNEIIKNETILSILNNTSYTATIVRADGSDITYTWPATNWYYSGDNPIPEGVTIAGGKTGTTDEGGNCLVILSKDVYGNPYISIVMKAATKDSLYVQMDRLLSYINTR
jgi:D-alanyl-D-alanine carboxypeptidase